LQLAPRLIFLFPEHITDGAWLSVTVTLCVQVAVLPLPSVTVQVTVVVPSGKATGALLVTEATEQLSPVAGVASTTLVAVQPLLVVAVTAAAQVMVGFTLSVTVTVCVQVAVLPLPSVTVQVTVVVPSGKATGASLVTEATEQLSIAVGVTKTVVAVHPALATSCTLAGQFMVGFSLSITVTVWLQGIETFPFWSVAVQTTVVFPIPNK